MSNYYNYPRQAALKITTINGKRCTAVPRNVQVTQPSTTAAAPKVSSTTTAKTPTNPLVDNSPAAPETTASTPPAQVTDGGGIVSNSPASTTAPSTIIPPAEAISDSTTDLGQNRSNPTSLPSGGTSNEINKNLTPAESSSRVAGASSTGTGGNVKATDHSTLVSAPTQNRSNVAPIVGGVMGTLIVFAIIGIILFFCRRRRKQKNTESLLSPPGTAIREKFYEIDGESLGPTKRSTRWKREISSRAENVACDVKATVAGFGTSIRATVSRDRSDTPNVNLDRGNSQFIRGSFNSHNRNQPSVLTASSGGSSLRERLAEWRKRFGEVWAHQKQGNDTRASMSQTDPMPDRRNTLTSELGRYRDSDQSGSTATKDLGLSLMDSQTSDLLKLENQPRDPFADPYADADPFCDPKHVSVIRPTKTYERPLSNPFAAGDNPFSDPVITNPPSTVPKPQTYIQHVRRSRGASVSSSNPSSKRSSRSTDLISFIDRPTSLVSLSQLPSVAAPSHSNDRDTLYSTFSDERRGKGRSDPFDLERPDLWIFPSQQRGSTLNTPASTANTSASRIMSMIAQNKARVHHRHNSSIRYSSGAESLEDWGSPRDYVEGSAHSSLRGNASSRGGNEEYGINDLRNGAVSKAYVNHAISGSLTEIKVTLNKDIGAMQELERRRNVDNVSPLSVEGKTT